MQQNKGAIPWNKGRKIKRQHHEGADYVQWRKSCFERDNFTCQVVEKIERIDKEMTDNLYKEVDEEIKKEELDKYYEEITKDII